VKTSPSIGCLAKLTVAGAVLCCVSLGQTATGSATANGQTAQQAILFTPVHPQTASKAAPLEAVSSSRLPVSFRSSTPSICVVNGSSVSLRREGVCIVQAMQMGNAFYAAAPAVTQSFTVKSAMRRGLFDVAQEGTIVLPSDQAAKQAFCPTPTLSPESPLTPDTWVPGATFRLTVTGSGFTTAANATKRCPSTVITAAMNGTEIKLSNLTVVNSSTISATVSVPAELPGGTVNVMLWGPDPTAKDEDTNDPPASKP